MFQRYMQMPVITVTRQEFIKMLVESGRTPEDSELQANLLVQIGSTMELNGKRLSIKEEKLKDAFDYEMKVGDKVLYSTGGSAGTVYHVAQVIKLYPSVKHKYKTSPNKIGVKVLESSKKTKFRKYPVIYAGNAVRLPVTSNVIWIPPEESE